MGSSPLTRGAPHPRSQEKANGRIIPAYAGSTKSARASRAVASGSFPLTRGARISCRLPSRTKRDHPRLRGEHLISLTWSVNGAGSSPLTRGAPSQVTAATGLSRIIPAYAGSTKGETSKFPPIWDHPRLRGEHVSFSSTSRQERGSSPLTRGAPHRAAGDAGGGRIIPAYAGSTATFQTLCSLS